MPFPISSNARSPETVFIELDGTSKAPECWEVRTPPSHHSVVQARGSDLRVHFKNTRESAMAIRNMELNKAKKYLEDVLAHRRAIPFRRFCGGVGRTGQAKNEGSTNGQARWPEKSARFLLGLLKNAESNAEVRMHLTSTIQGTQRMQPGWQGNSCTRHPARNVRQGCYLVTEGRKEGCEMSYKSGGRREDSEVFFCCADEGPGHRCHVHLSHPGQQGHAAEEAHLPGTRSHQPYAPPLPACGSVQHSVMVN